GTPRDALSESWSFDQFQHKGLPMLRFFESVNRADIRMIQRGKNLSFPPEAGDAIQITLEQLRQHLERDVAIKFCIAGAIHLPHAASAERGADFVGAEVGPGCERQRAQAIRNTRVLLTMFSGRQPLRTRHGTEIAFVTVAVTGFGPPAELASAV